MKKTMTEAEKYLKENGLFIHDFIKDKKFPGNHFYIRDLLEDYANRKIKNLLISDVRLSLPSVDKIEEDIKSCYETRSGGCGQWCGSDQCVGSCSQYSEYEVLNRSKLEKVIKGWRNEA